MNAALMKRYLLSYSPIPPLFPYSPIPLFPTGDAIMTIPLNPDGSDLSPYLPDEHGLFFVYHFTAEGVRTKDAAASTMDLAQLPALRHARAPRDRHRAGFAAAGARGLPVGRPWLPHRPRGRLALRRPAGPAPRLFGGGARAWPFPLRLQRHDADRRAASSRCDRSTKSARRSTTDRESSALRPN